MSKTIDAENALSDAIDDAVDRSEEAFALFGEPYGPRHQLYCAMSMTLWGAARGRLRDVEAQAPRETWELYEAGKAELEASGIAPREYEERLRELAERLGL